MSKNGNWFSGYLATNMGSVVLTTKKIVNFNCGAMRIKKHFNGGHICRCRKVLKPPKNRKFDPNGPISKFPFLIPDYKEI